MGLQSRLVRAMGLGDTKIIIENESSQVKVEVNVVFRGTVKPVVRRPLCASTSQRFSVEMALPILDPDELYASKLVAALDRQHPRDLYDVKRLFGAGGITDGMLDCLEVYLAGHNRPVHEVLFSNDKDIASEYDRAFVGMTEEACPLPELLAARTTMRNEITRRLSPSHRQFLMSITRGEPDWELLPFEHLSKLPALRWKQENLARFKANKPVEFARQVEALQTHFLPGFLTG